MFDWELDDKGTNLGVLHIRASEGETPIASAYIWKDDVDDKKYYWCFYYGWMGANVPFARGFRTEDTGGLALAMRDAEDAWLHNHSHVMHVYLVAHMN